MCREVKQLSAGILIGKVMRLWSLHPKYLDPQGLVALWREALLAQAVLRGETRGYQHHPQLNRFRDHAAPLSAMSAYLRAIYLESCARGYSFDKSKIHRSRKPPLIPVTSGQIEYEWKHLMAKLSIRNPQLCARWRTIKSPDCHPFFEMQSGPVAPWERTQR